MKFIDKASVLAIIEKLKDEALEYGDKSRWFLVAALAKEINSLKVKEVDLEKEVRQIIDLYLEAGKHYDDVIKKERNLYGYSDLAIKLLDRTADAKEMSIQYVLDKLRAQKGE